MPPKARLKADHFRRFLFELAERLGKTVKQLEHDLGQGELIEWMANDDLRRTSKPTRRHWKPGATTPELIT